MNTESFLRKLKTHTRARTTDWSVFPWTRMNTESFLRKLKTHTHASADDRARSLEVANAKRKDARRVIPPSTGAHANRIESLVDFCAIDFVSITSARASAPIDATVAKRERERSSFVDSSIDGALARWTPWVSRDSRRSCSPPPPQITEYTEYDR